MEYTIYGFLSKYFMPNEHIPIRRHRLSGLDICDVTTTELNNIEKEGCDVGLDFQIAEFCLAAALSFLAATLSNTPASNRVFTVFVVIIIVCFILGAIFGLKWWKGRGRFAKLIQEIRDRPIGPVGEEGKELEPGQLAALPSTEPPEEDDK